PRKNDLLQVRTGSFDTGAMFIDHLEQGAGEFAMKALSIPQEAKSVRSQGWESVRFLEFATQLAARHGFEVRTYGVTNHLYDRVDQLEEADFAFLASRCTREGYGLKVTDRKVILFDESAEASRTETTTIRTGDMIGQFRFIDKSTDIYGSCRVFGRGPTGERIQAAFTAPDTTGPMAVHKLALSNQAEADRWARGLLRSANKYRVTGTLTVTMNTGLAAGSVVRIDGVGLFDGLYVIDQLTHDPVHDRTKLTLRKPLEGYA
ncbi:phage late control D family protein, partial [Gorillibacterium sp. sgz5001074]|uniref:phage late control D family protein n=1 Tax=Gorillibacterium sp. sgz5001074 TaxID=3446695 RepID=UPI003F673F3C